MLKIVQDPCIAAETIDMKFLVTGHSLLLNDSEFAVIKSFSKKHQNIFVPQDWFNITKRKQLHYEVIEMKKNDFLSTNAIEEAISNRNRYQQLYCELIEKSVVSFWRRIIIFNKITLNNLVDFREINVKKASGQKECSTKIPLYYSKVYNFSEKNDMISVLPYFPQCTTTHDYFQNLPLVTSTRATQLQPEIADDELVYDE